MSFDVSPIAGSLSAASAVDRARRLSGRDKPAFAESVDKAAAPPIPAEVWDQVDAAARLAEGLHAQGKSVRFDVHKLDGGVVASLVDEDGGLLRPMLLADVVDVHRLSSELDKE
jgi:hypothetical protein